MVQHEGIFLDRTDAGFELGKLLEARYKNKNALVLGIPRGGVLVAYEVAKLLEGQLSILITKKLPHPLQEELAIGAVAEDGAEDGSVYLTSYSRGFNNDEIKLIVDAQSKEIQSRIQRFRKGKPLPDMSKRIVIIVDDGIATGSTIVPAIKLCKLRNAASVIIAAPVSGQHYVPDIDKLADDVVIAEQPEDFHAVGQVYEDFHHLSDEEVITVLQRFDHESKSQKYNS
jgi:putative phosphoribosyl transferase